MSSSERAPGMEHIPKYPPGFIALRILQLIVGLVCLGLSAYTIAMGALSGNSLMLFTSLVTVGVTIWLTAAHSCAKHAYNYWAVLAFDILLTIFWLVSFAVTAVAAAALLALGSMSYSSSYDSYFDYDYDYDYYSSYDFLDMDDDELIAFGAVFAASAGLGALNFLFFFISLIIHSCVVYRHRRAGLHSKRGPAAAAVSQPYQMTPQTKPQYAAVPQQGVPFNQQETAYNPHAMYAPPMQQQQQQPVQGYYAPPNSGTPQPYYQPPQSTSPPIVAQPTGGSFHQPASPQPPQGAYQAPYQPPYQQQ